MSLSLASEGFGSICGSGKAKWNDGLAKVYDAQ